MALAAATKPQRINLIFAAAAIMTVAVAFFIGRERFQLPASISNDTVVASLGAKMKPYPQSLRTAAKHAREAPDDVVAATAAAREYMNFGRSVGDARYFGAALGVLRPWLDGVPSVEVLNLGASARQYGHDFSGALELLDRALVIDRANAQALLARANINIVQGRLATAWRDCRSLVRTRRDDLVLLCDATAKALGDEAPQAYQRLDRLLRTNAIDLSLRGYAFELKGEMAGFLLRPDEAATDFEAARKEDPADLRTIMQFADFKLRQGQPNEALALLADAPPTDSVMVRQAIAHKALGDKAETDRLAAALRERFDEQALLKDAAHAREAARFWLFVAQDPQKALAAAEANWRLQRELEDALLLVDASAAAGNLAAVKPVLDWAAEEKVTAPLYLEHLKLAGLAP